MYNRYQEEIDYLVNSRYDDVRERFASTAEDLCYDAMMAHLEKDLGCWESTHDELWWVNMCSRIDNGEL